MPNNYSASLQSIELAKWNIINCYNHIWNSFALLCDKNFSIKYSS